MPLVFLNLSPRVVMKTDEYAVLKYANNRYALVVMMEDGLLRVASRNIPTRSDAEFLRDFQNSKLLGESCVKRADRLIKEFVE
jgi:hypothetical protein